MYLWSIMWVTNYGCPNKYLHIYIYIFCQFCSSESWILFWQALVARQQQLMEAAEERTSLETEHLSSTELSSESAEPSVPMARSGRPEQGRGHEQLIASVNREKAQKNWKIILFQDWKWILKTRSLCCFGHVSPWLTCSLDATEQQKRRPIEHIILGTAGYL